MKTTIKTFIAIGVLAFGGVINSNASDSSKSANIGLVTGVEKNLRNLRLGECVLSPAEKIALPEAMPVENFNEDFDYRLEAQSIIKAIADKEEAKAVQEIMNRSFQGAMEGNDSFEFAGATTNLREEAQLVTKSLADEAEAKAISQLVADGKLTETDR
jgi:hypothetical protein